ncbi:hypothetical protein HUG10_09195 [Halorarum halophilum]|uniref:Uncharacterized protein n=1 Tax=Halorarum halophilum TaxID=2743090 RepID=A0A7D5KFM1_9EURY|nr:hypothetical protein [Halobaculum halophilum]QLG27716.1 hypothetical protein HUG10_09195 [Halobaculum halophilum]
MVLDTTAEVGKVQAVRDRDGNARPAADADNQRELQDRVGNFDGLKQVVHQTSGDTAEILPSHSVPHGVEVLVEYRQGNSGAVFVGDADTQAAALTAAGQGRTFRVTDTSLIHVRTPTAGDEVVVTFES